MGAAAMPLLACCAASCCAVLGPLAPHDRLAGGLLPRLLRSVCRAKYRSAAHCYGAAVRKCGHHRCDATGDWNSHRWQASPRWAALFRTMVATACSEVQLTGLRRVNAAPLS